jgi:hypothetical protein
MTASVLLEVVEEEEDSDDIDRGRRFPLLVKRINFRNDLGGDE